jgi:hypothetical protein
LNGEVEELFESRDEEVVSVLEELVSVLEEVVSVLVDRGEVPGDATCWAKEDPHKASRTTTLREKFVDRVFGLVFMVIV